MEKLDTADPDQRADLRKRRSHTLWRKTICPPVSFTCPPSGRCRSALSTRRREPAPTAPSSTPPFTGSPNGTMYMRAGPWYGPIRAAAASGPRRRADRADAQRGAVPQVGAHLAAEEAAAQREALEPQHQVAGEQADRGERDGHADPEGQHQHEAEPRPAPARRPPAAAAAPRGSGPDPRPGPSPTRPRDPGSPRARAGCGRSAERHPLGRGGRRPASRARPAQCSSCPWPCPCPCPCPWPCPWPCPCPCAVPVPGAQLGQQVEPRGRRSAGRWRG